MVDAAKLAEGSQLEASSRPSAVQQDQHAEPPEQARRPREGGRSGIQRVSLQGSVSTAIAQNRRTWFYECPLGFLLPAAGVWRFCRHWVTRSSCRFPLMFRAPGITASVHRCGVIKGHRPGGDGSIQQAAPPAGDPLADASRLSKECAAQFAGRLSNRHRPVAHPAADDGVGRGDLQALLSEASTRRRAKSPAPDDLEVLPGVTRHPVAWSRW